MFDAVRVRLIEVGEAVKGLSTELIDANPEIPWREVAGMRDRLAHRYFDTSHAIIRRTVEVELPDLLGGVRRLRELI